MADQKSFFSRRFGLGLLIYALAFLLLLGIGFIFFWNFMDAYEQSRPQHPLNAYMEQLTADYILDKSDAAAAQIDSRLQSKEQSLSYLESAIADDLKCIKKIKACTDSKLVYSIFCGPKIIGTIDLERQGEARFGFAACCRKVHQSLSRRIFAYMPESSFWMRPSSPRWISPILT